VAANKCENMRQVIQIHNEMHSPPTTTNTKILKLRGRVE